MDEGGAQGDGAGVADAQVQELRRREDAVVGRSVGDRVADNFSNLDTTDLVEEEHLPCLWPVEDGRRVEERKSSLGDSDRSGTTVMSPHHGPPGLKADCSR